DRRVSLEVEDRYLVAHGRLRLAAAVLPDKENRDRRAAHDVLGITAHHDSPQAPAAVCAAHYEIRAPFLGGFDDELPSRGSDGLQQLRFDLQLLLTGHR